MKILIVLLLTAKFCYSQTNGVPFNKLDDNGEKHGYWKTLLDSNLNQVNDTVNATWYYFRLFNHGKFVYGLGDTMIKSKHLNEFTFISKPELNDLPSAIDDTVHLKWNLKDPNEYILIFDNGFLKEEHRIFSKDGGNWQIFNYKMKYKDNPYSYFVRIINSWSNKKINQGYYYYEDGKRRKEFQVIDVKSNNYDQNNTF